MPKSERIELRVDPDLKARVLDQIGARETRMMRVRERRQVPHIAWSRGAPYVVCCGIDHLDAAAMQWAFGRPVVFKPSAPQYMPPA